MDYSTLSRAQQKAYDYFYSNKEFTDKKELLDLPKVNGSIMYKVYCKHCKSISIQRKDRILSCPIGSLCQKEKASLGAKITNENQRINNQHKIQELIDKFNSNVEYTSKKELLEIIPPNTEENEGHTYIYKTKCKDCGSIMLQRYDRILQCPPGSKCYKEKFKDSWLTTWDNKSEKEKQLYKEKQINYYQNLSQEKKDIIKQNKRLAWENKPIDEKILWRQKLSNQAKGYFEQDRPNLHILHDKELVKQYLQGLSEKPSLYDLSDFFNIANHYILYYLKEYDLLDLINYTEKTASLFQQDVEAFIKSLNIEYQQNVHSVLQNKRLELDIYIPQHNLAIECNGLYYHYYPLKPVNYHTEKSRQCEDLNIRLIHIWEHEWEDPRKRTILKSIIKNALGITENKVYARNTYCSIEESASLKEFVNQNNIAGFRGGKFAITLRDKKTHELLMTYIFGHAYFGKGKYQYEVIRGATKLNTSVIGGASKIWKYFIEHFNPESCVYYIDYNYFNGSSVTKLGLQYITSQPGIWNWWVSENKVTNRDPSRHKEIQQLISEDKIRPIYNAGTKVYVYIKKTT